MFLLSARTLRTANIGKGKSVQLIAIIIAIQQINVQVFFKKSFQGKGANFWRDFELHSSIQKRQIDISHLICSILIGFVVLANLNYPSGFFHHSILMYSICILSILCLFYGDVALKDHFFIEIYHSALQQI